MNFNYFVKTEENIINCGLVNYYTETIGNINFYIADLVVYLPNGEIMQINRTEYNVNPNYPIVYYKNSVDDRYHRIINGQTYLYDDFREVLILCVDVHFPKDSNIRLLSSIGHKIRIIKNNEVLIDIDHIGKIKTRIFEYGFAVELTDFITKTKRSISSQKPTDVIEVQQSSLFGDGNYLTTIQELMTQNKIIEEESVNFYFTIENDINSTMIMKYAYSKEFSMFLIENEFKNDPTRNILIKVPKDDIKSIFFLYYAKVKSKNKNVSILGIRLSSIYTDYDFDDYDEDKHAIRSRIACKYGVSLFDSREVMANKYGKEHLYKLFTCEITAYTDGYSPWSSIYFSTLALYFGYNSSRNFHSSKDFNDLKCFYTMTKSRLLQNEKPRHNSEIELYRLLKLNYPNTVYQYRDTWLGALSLDVFVPELSVGIEYQGKQHFERTSLFGLNEEKFSKLVERDKKKKLLCLENGINLLYWDSSMKINIFELNRLFMKNGVDQLSIEINEPSLGMELTQIKDDLRESLFK